MLEDILYNPDEDTTEYDEFTPSFIPASDMKGVVKYLKESDALKEFNKRLKKLGIKDETKLDIDESKVFKPLSYDDYTKSMNEIYRKMQDKIQQLKQQQLSEEEQLKRVLVQQAQKEAQRKFSIPKLLNPEDLSLIQYARFAMPPQEKVEQPKGKTFVRSIAEAWKEAGEKVRKGFEEGMAEAEKRKEEMALKAERALTQQEKVGMLKKIPQFIKGFVEAPEKFFEAVTGVGPSQEAVETMPTTADELHAREWGNRIGSIVFDIMTYSLASPIATGAETLTASQLAKFFPRFAESTGGKLLSYVIGRGTLGAAVAGAEEALKGLSQPKKFKTDEAVKNVVDSAIGMALLGLVSPTIGEGARRTIARLLPQAAKEGRLTTALKNAIIGAAGGAATGAALGAVDTALRFLRNPKEFDIAQAKNDILSRVAFFVGLDTIMALLHGRPMYMKEPTGFRRVTGKETPLDAYEFLTGTRNPAAEGYIEWKPGSGVWLDPKTNLPVLREVVKITPDGRKIYKLDVWKKERAKLRGTEYKEPVRKAEEKVTEIGYLPKPEEAVKLEKKVIAPKEKEEIKSVTAEPAKVKAKEVEEKAPTVSPKVGGTYEVEIIKSTGGLKEGQKIVGRVDKIFKVKSGAVLAKVITEDRKEYNVPVSKYAVWRPADVELKPVEKEPSMAAEEVTEPTVMEKVQEELRKTIQEKMPEMAEKVIIIGDTEPVKTEEITKAETAPEAEATVKAKEKKEKVHIITDEQAKHIAYMKAYAPNRKLPFLTKDFTLTLADRSIFMPKDSIVQFTKFPRHGIVDYLVILPNGERVNFKLDEKSKENQELQKAIKKLKYDAPTPPDGIIESDYKFFLKMDDGSLVDLGLKDDKDIQEIVLKYRQGEITKDELIQLSKQIEAKKKAETKEEIKPAEKIEEKASTEIAQNIEEQVVPQEYIVYRRDTSKADLSASRRPQGLYLSLVQDKATFKTPHEEAGDTDYWGIARPKNPLFVDPIWVEHARFRPFTRGPASAAVAALKKLLTEEEFNKVLKMSKQELLELLKREFPGYDYDKYAQEADAYALLEAYAAQLARKRGYDAIIQVDPMSPEFSELVALKDDILEISPQLEKAEEKGGLEGGREEGRGLSGDTGSGRPDGGDKTVLGEVETERDTGIEEKEEVRGARKESGSTNIEDKRTDIQTATHGPRDKGREGLSDKSREDKDSDVHGGRGSEEDASLRATRERSSRERRNYVMTDEEIKELESRSELQIAKDNVEAIRLLKKLEEEGRLATPEEQKILAKYGGWGPAWKIFASYRYSQFGKVSQELKDLVGYDEYSKMSRTTQYAHYTSPEIVKAMWQAARNFGFKGGRVLEPAMGAGYFYSLMPADLMNKSKLVGVEIDPIAGNISKHLFPDAKIYVQGFEETALPDNFFDLVISNVPFGNVAVYDPNYPHYITNRIHNYFIVKAIDKTKPGGIVMVITSTGTLDAPSNKDIREYISKKADFIGAIRLPSSAFEKIAKTEVTSDIIILRKRKEGEKSRSENWIETVPSGVVNEDGKELPINEYFKNHPEMIIGKLVVDKLHPDRIGVDGRDLDIVAELEKAFNRLPQNILATEEEPKEIQIEISEDIKQGKAKLQEGTVIVKGDKVYKVSNGELKEIKGKNKDKIKALAEIRDAALEVLKVQYNSEPDSVLKKAQDRLNKLYDSFVEKHSYIAENISLIEDDPNSHVLAALENVELDKKGNIVKVSKADIFTKRTIRGLTKEIKVSTPIEALSAVLAERGKVDIDRMAEMLGRPAEEIVKELKGRIYKNPETNEYELAEKYLSGNVRAKLAVAKAAAEIDPAFKENVEALEKVQPKDLEPHEISMSFGSPWIPLDYIEQFIADKLVLGVNVVMDVTGKYSIVPASKYGKSNEGYANTHVYGTKQNPAVKLIELALNKKLPVEKKRTPDGKYVIDDEKTEFAIAKQRELEQMFVKWILSDEKRAREVAKTYNEKFNAIRIPKYDGSHLVFPGLSADVKPWPHQVNAVWRILTSDTGVLLAHGVGKGKTLTMAMAGMELRRLGIAKKPMYVVPVNLFEQFVREFKKYYPAAKILAIDADKLPNLFKEEIRKGETPEQFEARREENRRKRKEMLLKIAANDWDAVIVTDTVFMRIPVSPELEHKYIQEELRILREFLEAIMKNKDTAKKFQKSIKEIERIIQNKEAKLKVDISSLKRDIVIPFEELGIDWLFVDEAHRYKSLPITTRMNDVVGVPSSTSDRAIDMHLKTRYILDINKGKGVVFATGTPITNTMAELYNLMRFLAPDILKSLNIGHFDRWAEAFVRVDDILEVEVSGAGYKKKRGLKEFVNVPELRALYHSFADVVPNRLDDPGIPKLKTGGRIIITVEPSQEQLELIEWCVERLEAVRRKAVTPKEDNPLKIAVDANKISIDPRLINPNYPDNPNSKINKAVEKIYEIWARTKDKKSTQLVFLDISVPERKEKDVEEDDIHTEKAENRENIILYEDIKRKLVNMGIPENEIAFIHEAKNKEQKAALVEKFRNGDIRILIGSTDKMGVGLNIQKKLIALHHLDVSWRPDEIEQREGRILRPGNENEEVEIYVYGTKRTFDIARWNKVVYKANFINQVLTGDTDTRAVEDIGNAVVLNYQEALAAVTDNPLIHEKARVDAEVFKLQVLKRQHYENIMRIKKEINDLQERNQQLEEIIPKWEKDLEAKKDTSGDKFEIEINGVKYKDRAKANAAIKEAVSKIKLDEDRLQTKVRIGNFAGFDLYIIKTKTDTEWMLVGNASYTSKVSDDTIRSMEAILGNLRERLKIAKSELEYNKEQIKVLEEQTKQPFQDEDKLQELLARQRQINIQLGIDEGVGGKAVKDMPVGDDGVYPLPELDKIRAEADKGLATRVKGIAIDNIYALPELAQPKASRKQVARGLKVAVEEGIFKKGMTVVDVGGGIFEEGTNYLAQHGIRNLVYDPYARPQEHNEAVLKEVYDKGGADGVALNNVLNVIPSRDERKNVLRFSYGLLKNGSKMIITVYEGDGSGKGKKVEYKDGTWSWQENRKLDDYEEEIKEALPPDAVIEKKRNAYIITKPKDTRIYTFYSLAKPYPDTAPINDTFNPYKLSPNATKKIAEKLTEALETAIMGTGRSKALSGNMAVYLEEPHVVLSKKKYLGEWRVIGHELGHAFMEYTQIKPDRTEMLFLIEKLYPGGLEKVKPEKVEHEGFAEFLMLYFADNDKAKEWAPKTYEEFERLLEHNPKIADLVDEALMISRNDLEGTPLARVSLYTNREADDPFSFVGTYDVGEYFANYIARGILKEQRGWIRKHITFTILDASLPLKDLYREAAKKGYKGIDPSKLFATSGMALKKAKQLFVSGKTYIKGKPIKAGKRPLAEIFKEAMKEPDGLILLENIWRAYHSLERHAKGIKTALPKEVAEEAVKQAEKEYPHLVKLAKEAAETFSELNIQILLAAEVISEKTAEKLREYKWYMPLYAVSKGRKGTAGIPKEPLRGSGPGVLRAKGHTTAELPMLEALTRRLYSTVVAAEYNEIMHAIEEALKLPDMGQFGVFVDRPTVMRRVKIRDVLSRLKDVFDEVHVISDENPNPDLNAYLTLFLPGGSQDLKKTETILISRHGDEEVYMLVSPALFEAVQALKPLPTTTVIKVLANLSKVSRFSKVSTFVFVLNNLTRDLAQALLQTVKTGEGGLSFVFKRYAQAFLITTGLKKEKAEEIMNLFVQSGAYGGAPIEVLDMIARASMTDGLIATPAPGWKRTLTGVLARIVRIPDEVLRVSEETTRVAEFLKVLDKELKDINLTLEDVLKGEVPHEKSEEVYKALTEAAYATREITVNYGLRGTSETATNYMRAVEFLRAGLQGLYRFKRWIWDEIRDNPSSAKDKAWRLFWVLAVPTLISWLLMKDDKYYKDLPPEARARYWWFPVPFKKGENLYIAIAKPYEYTIFTFVAEKFYDWLFGPYLKEADTDTRNALEDFLTSIKYAFTPNLVPLVVQTLVGIYANKDTLGRPIETMSDKLVPPEYRYKADTPALEKWLSKMLVGMGIEVSPKQIDYLVTQTLGSYGRVPLQLLSLESPFKKQYSGAEYSFLIGTKIYGPGEMGSRIVDKFYSDYKLAEQLKNAEKKFSRQLSEREKKLVYAYPAMRAVADTISVVRKNFKTIQMDDSVPPEEKRKAMLFYKWYSRFAAGYLYGVTPPPPPAELGLTSEQINDIQKYLENKINNAMINAEIRKIREMTQKGEK